MTSLNNRYKFRAWDKVSAKIINSNDDLFYKHSLPKIQAAKDLILMQYTGLKDINGKEIYENDIIVFNNYMKITMSNGCWVAECKNEREMLLCSLHDQVEVVGNIHENKELLNK